jgi:glycogen debranching enzyme
MSDSIPAREASGKGGGSPVLARSGVTDDRSRVLKHADTFAVFDHRGDVKSGGLDEEGLYHRGTRHLSQLVLQLDGDRPFFLSSTSSRESGHVSVALTNHDRLEGGRVVTPLGALQLSFTRFLFDATLYQRLTLKNYALERMQLELGLIFSADFADIFEVRGMTRVARGRDLLPEISSDQVVFAYRGLDEVVRRTVLKFDPAPSALSASSALLQVSLAPGEEREVCVTIACEVGGWQPKPFAFESARELARHAIELTLPRGAPVETSNSQVNSWVNRAASDLRMMITELPTGPYPYAGVPWFNTPFGRDGIIAALECLWWTPELAKGVLRYLASTQATELVPEEDAEPGKILHEIRNGEMAALKEMPFGRYYGSVDATPLFVVLLDEYYQRTADSALVDELWPHAESALAWIEKYGDQDGDGFVEYHRQKPTGLVHQGWKDSDDAVFHANGQLAEGPIALCEVQGYVYAALRAGARLGLQLGLEPRAKELARRAEKLKRRFDRVFWCEDLGTYALALDGRKRPCCVRSSNAGQCLFSGLVLPERAAQLSRTLLAEHSFSGWGIRTLSEGMPRYNPMGYHTGSVWPHDNALIALGLSRMGHNDLALSIFAGLQDAGTHFDLERMPELFCGFQREPGAGPVLYPVACAPQAWSAASVFLLFQACLGLAIDAPTRTLRLSQPRLPPGIDWLELRELSIGDATLDVLFERHEDDVGVNVLRREGSVRTIVEK